MRQRHRVRKIGLAAGVVVISAGLVGGCGSKHYRVTDTTSGKEYYTTKVRDKDGSVRFTEAETARKVTLNSAEVEKISKQEFRRATRPN